MLLGYATGMLDMDASHAAGMLLGCWICWDAGYAGYADAWMLDMLICCWDVGYAAAGMLDMLGCWIC